MRCIVHISGATGNPTKKYMVRIFALQGVEARRLIEEFSNCDLIRMRLREIGLSEAHVLATLTNLQGGIDSVWSDVEVQMEMLDRFGRGDGQSRFVA